MSDKYRHMEEAWGIEGNPFPSEAIRITSPIAFTTASVGWIKAPRRDEFRGWLNWVLLYTAERL